MIKQNCYTHLVVVVVGWWFSCSVVSDSLRPQGLWPARLLYPWDFPRQEYWSGLPFLLQGIFSTQESNRSLLHFRRTLPTELQGKPP